MGKPVRLPDLPAPAAADDPQLVEFGFAWADLCRLWELLLALAVRDGASSVHYHPWRADGHLSYVVAGARYAMVPPPPELARRVALAAGALACGTRLGAACRRWLGRPVRASGVVRLEGPAGPSEWAGVVWSAGSRVGVEWYRLDPAGGPAEPGAAADPRRQDGSGG